MWKLKLSEDDDPTIASVNNHIGRQFWEFDDSLDFPPSLPLLLASLLFLLLIIRHLKKLIGSSSPKQKWPPGPRKLPFIGNFHQLICSSPLPYRSCLNLSKQYGPIMHLQLGQVPVIVISSQEAAEEVLKIHELSFLQRSVPINVNVMSYGGSGIIFAPHSNHWREMRKVCVMELFNSSRVESFRSLRENEVWSFIESIHNSSKGRQNSPINLTQQTLQLNARITFTAAFGYACKDLEAAMSLLVEGTECALNLVDWFPSLNALEFLMGFKSKLNKLHQRLDKVLDSIINEHKERRAANVHVSGEQSKGNDHEDLMDVLLKLQESNEHSFSMTNVKAAIWEIIGAGIDTSARTMDWAMSEMIKNPRIIKKAQEEARRVLQGRNKTNIEDYVKDLKYLRSVIMETLRLHPPLPLTPRESTDNCKINGYDIPANTQILINVYAIATNRESWGDDAECFKPERFEGSVVNYNGTCFQYLPFGSGRRICPGISFANAVMELVLGLLLCHFDWEVAGGIRAEDIDMTEVFEVATKRKNDLCLIPVPVAFSFA